MVDDGYWIRVHRRVMACRFEVVLPGEDASRVSAARTALNLADRLESRLTVFRESSDLSRINRTASDGAVTVHSDVFSLLRRAADLHEATEGAFDITSTPLSRCWGFLRRHAALPPEAAIDAARQCVGMQRVTLDAAAKTVRFARTGIELNLGSIGKGYALDRMGTKLRRLGVHNALLSAGGSSILALGTDCGTAWPVHVSSKLCGEARLAKLRLQNAAMATSGAGEQFVTIDGRRYGHVLDPRTGWPASGVLSATVVTGEATDADALATAFLVGGPSLAERYCSTNPGVLAILAVDDEKQSIVRFGACAGATVEED